MTAQPFRLMWLLAEALTGDGRIVSKEEIEETLFSGQSRNPNAAADAVRQLRNKLRPLLRDTEPKDVVQTRQPKGYVLNLRPEELKLVP